METREWFAVPDPDETGRTWSFDVTFLTSRWTCIYGNGCQGVHESPSPELMQGCCSHGAYAADKLDRKRVESVVPSVSAEDWQFAELGQDGVFVKIEKGEWRTKLVDDACIFLNRPGFDGKVGCALHHHADRHGIHFREVKPEVCWQLPIRRYDTVRDDKTILSEIGEFSRAAWDEGGSEFAWWCTEAPEAFVGESRVYESMKEELIGMVGEAVYKTLATYLDGRREAGALITHP
ncbi:MAG: hypothetical protein WBD02_06020, partial [Acidimicrobiia bacterium]